MAVEIYGATESEHLFNQELFMVPSIKAALESIKFSRDGAADRITLYNSQAITDTFAKLSDSHSMGKALRASGYGMVWYCTEEATRAWVDTKKKNLSSKRTY
jgi:hypothetical protein